MAVKDITTADVTQLVNTRDLLTGLTYPESGKQPWHNWLIQTLAHQSQASAYWLLVKEDDANDTTVRVMPGWLTIDGSQRQFTGDVIDLVAYDDSNAYVWMYLSGGDATIGAGPTLPSSSHVPLAMVALASGAITSVDDLRPAGMMVGGISKVVSAERWTYVVTITSQGDTAAASEITVQTKDTLGSAIAEQHFIRAWICDDGGFADATNAIIAAGSDTAAVKTLTANKDLILQSDAYGVFKIGLADDTAETVTLRFGAPDFQQPRADYHNAEIDVTHAAS